MNHLLRRRSISSKFARVSLYVMLASYAVPCVASTGGDGSIGNPYTGLSINNALDAGTTASPRYYSISSGDVTNIRSDTLLNIGNRGQSNILTITDGASVQNVELYIGYGVEGNTAAGGNNEMIVTGSGAAYTVTLDSGSPITYIGRYGCTNRLVVKDSASFSSGGLFVGFGNLAAPSNGSGNRIIVGTDSAGDTASMSVAGNLDIGYYGNENSMLIQSGATVTSTGWGVVGNGYNAAEVAAHSTNVTDGIGYHNSVTVTGSGSSWIMRNSGDVYQDLYVGNYGCSNSLSITSGGLVKSGKLEIGHGNSTYGETGGYNTVTVGASEGSGDTSALSVNGILYVGYRGSHNTLTVQSGASATVTGDGFIGYGGETSTNTENGIGYANRVVVRGGGSSLTFNNGTADTNLHVGYYGSSNTMLISDGGRVSNGDAYIGNTSISGKNVVVVSGNGSQWRNSGNLYVSNFGNGTLIVDDGALVTASTYIFGSTSDMIDLGEPAMDGVGSLLTTDAGGVYLGTGVIYLGYDSYIAVLGDISADTDAMNSLLSGILVFDSTSRTWVTATDSLVPHYYAIDNQGGSDFTHGSYTDLEGYTIFTTAVPEPSTYALLGGAVVLVWSVRRRRK